jgi:hypothetical protein
MITNWFKVYNLQDFIDTGLVSREIDLDLPTLGLTTVMLTKGIGYGLRYEDYFLPIQLNDKNPYIIDNILIYLDPDDDIWLGLLSES